MMSLELIALVLVIKQRLPRSSDHVLLGTLPLKSNKIFIHYYRHSILWLKIVLFWNPT